MPVQETPDWDEWFARFEQELGRLGVPRGSRGLLWDPRPEGMVFLASPAEEWYSPVEEAVERLASLPDGAGITGLRARLADWRGELPPTLPEEADEAPDA